MNENFSQFGSGKNKCERMKRRMDGVKDEWKIVQFLLILIFRLLSVVLLIFCCCVDPRGIRVY